MRTKNEVHAILHAHLIPPWPHAELFGMLGWIWRARQVIPDDQGAAIERHLRDLDRLGDELAVVDRRCTDVITSTCPIFPVIDTVVLLVLNQRVDLPVL